LPPHIFVHVTFSTVICAHTSAVNAKTRIRRRMEETGRLWKNLNEVREGHDSVKVARVNQL
jgi:hypothetical protein